MSDLETSTPAGPPTTAQAVDAEWLVNQIAHALRNPIFAAVMQAESAALVAGDPERLRRTLSSLEQQVQRLQRTIEEMLLFGRPVRIARDRTVVATLLRGTVEGWRTASPGRVCAPVVRIDPGVGEARWDQRAIQQILERLLDNAEQHTPPPHEVEVEVVPSHESEVILIVRDRGEGIPADLLERVVLPFVPQHRGRPGLGLTVVDKLARALGGRLEILSEEGAGTEVRVTLPRDEPER